MSTVTVRMRVKPEKEKRFLEILSEVISKMKLSEPDTRVYAVWKTQNINEYLLVESYVSEAGRELHNRNHTEVFSEFIACLAGPPVTEALEDFVVGVPDTGSLPIVQKSLL